MYRLVLLLVCLLALPLWAGAPLTNDDVLVMVRAGISADVIIEKIKSSPTAFTTTTEALIHLSEAKVPEAVIKQMVAAVPAPAAAAAPSVSTPAVTLEGVEFWQGGGAGFRGNLIVDQRGLTFCCGQNLQVRNQYIRCTMSFRIPLATVAAVYVMNDAGKMPGFHIVDTAPQGYYFFTDNLNPAQRDKVLAAFPAAVDALLTLKPSITREDHPWKDHKTILHSYTAAAITDGNVCVEPDYELKPWGNQ